jgi:hypothetical protein
MQGYSQGNVLGPLLYLLCTEDLTTSPESNTATFIDDTAVLATDSDSAIASHKLQTNLLQIQNRFKKWRMKANGSAWIPIQAFILHFLTQFWKLENES